MCVAGATCQSATANSDGKCTCTKGVSEAKGNICGMNLFRFIQHNLFALFLYVYRKLISEFYSSVFLEPRQPLRQGEMLYNNLVYVSYY